LAQLYKLDHEDELLHADVQLSDTTSEMFQSVAPRLILPELGSFQAPHDVYSIKANSVPVDDYDPFSVNRKMTVPSELKFVKAADGRQAKMSEFKSTLMVLSKDSSMTRI
jgi:hypothetical protein